LRFELQIRPSCSGTDILSTEIERCEYSKNRSIASRTVLKKVSSFFVSKFEIPAGFGNPISVIADPVAPMV
jgi:hypothetical protein